MKLKDDTQANLNQATAQLRLNSSNDDDDGSYTAVVKKSESSKDSVEDAKVKSGQGASKSHSGETEGDKKVRYLLSRCVF
jgi:hypothetical protein